MSCSATMQEIDPELSLDLFDHIDDLLDFPNEDMDGKIGDGMEINWPADDLFGLTNCTLTGHVEGGFDHRAGDFPLPCEDMAELEWLSNFVEDSFSGGSAAAATTTAAVEDHNGSSHIVSDTTQFRTSSPVSVLESSSCSGKALSFGSNDALLSVPAKARSKRPRPPAFSPRLPTTTNNNSVDDDSSNNNLISPSSSASNPSSSDLSSQFQFEFDAESFAESKPPSKKVPKSVGGQRNRKALMEQQGNVAVRKCLHCGIQKTPQWRMGPMGPKTLCNACGVRYKSGRLFPEYRPAASPTFLASKHSNSHKKVMEMRTKKSAVAEERLVQKQPHELLFLRDTMVGYM